MKLIQKIILYPLFYISTIFKYLFYFSVIFDLIVISINNYDKSNYTEILLSDSLYTYHASLFLFSLIISIYTGGLIDNYESDEKK